MIHFRCPVCLHEMEAPDSLSGQTVTCSKCPQQIVLPSHSTPLPALPPKVGNGNFESYIAYIFYGLLAFSILLIISYYLAKK
jgi:hypothetical protein